MEKLQHVMRAGVIEVSMTFGRRKLQGRSDDFLNPLPQATVANVDRNLCNQKSSFVELCAFGTRLKAIEEIQFRIAAGSRNTRSRFLSDFAFHSLSFFASFAGMRISHSLYAFGVHPRSGLWLPRAAAAAKFTSDQYVYITSCSRIPVIRKNSYQSRHSVRC